jgi:cell wall-associated NlpC family hydrolase
MWLQRDLTAVGFATRVTNEFNKQTQSEVKSFQTKYSLQADGVVGPATFAELRVLLREAANQPDAGAASTSATGASATTGTQALPSGDSGGAGFVPPPADSAFVKATINSQGLAVPGIGTPAVVQEVIAAANTIAFKPYIYGGGHTDSWALQAGYDCSGSTSYALHGGGLLEGLPLDSTQFESYGQPGLGRWITLFTNAGHVYMNIAGLWFDTGAQSADNGNDRWSATRASPKAGFEIVHPTGW